MKLLIYSDLHLEFDGFHPKKEWFDQCDAVIQVGDLHHAPQNIGILKSWDKPVFFVPGNHDFWNPMVKIKHQTLWDPNSSRYEVRRERTINQALKEMEEATLNSKVQILSNKSVQVNDVRLIGTTLWYNADSINSFELKNLNDYYRIFGDSGQFITSSEITQRHYESIEFIKEELAKPFKGKTVLLTHHPAWVSPEVSKKESCHRAYGTNLEKIWKGKVDLMVHGHLHANINLQVDPKTRIICNPRGYPNEPVRLSFQKNLTVEI